MCIFYITCFNTCSKVQCYSFGGEEGVGDCAARLMNGRMENFWLQFLFLFFFFFFCYHEKILSRTLLLPWFSHSRSATRWDFGCRSLGLLESGASRKEEEFLLIIQYFGLRKWIFIALLDAKTEIFIFCPTFIYRISCIIDLFFSFFSLSAPRNIFSDKQQEI